MKYDVITFGSAILDAFVTSPDFRILNSHRSLTGRFLAVPYGTKTEVTDLTFASGGGGTNTAVGFSRLGLKTAVVSRLGWDFAGKFIRDDLKKEKVDLDFLCQFEGEATDWSIILLGSDGNRTAMVWRGNTRLERSLINFKLINSFWFYITSLEGNLDLLEDLVTFARENHIKVALNPGAKELQEKSRLLEIANLVEVFIVNQEEASKLLNYCSREEAFELLCSKTDCPLLVVTNGENGIEARVNKEKLILPSFKVKMINQLGAGDGFGCGLVGGLARGMKPKEALRLGLANGASVVGKIGAKTGLLKEAEITFWLK